MPEGPPESLRAEVARTLRPVRPVASPGRRVALLIPAGALLLAVVPLIWGVRFDAPVLGPLRLWGASALQMAVGLVVLAAALAESMPGRLSARWRVGARALIGLAFMVALTMVTFLASPRDVPPLLGPRYFRVCIAGSFSLGILLLAALGVLMRVGLTARPVLAGATAGLGAGLVGDAAWRVYCEVSDPAHVLTAHLGAMAALVLAGVLAGALVRARSRMT